MTVLLMAALGLVLIVAGVVARRRVKAMIASSPENESLARRRMVASIVGPIAAVLTWPFTYALGYPYPFPNGQGRVVGIPFMVAYFDADGFDYVGPLSLPALLGNAYCAFLLPHIVLFLIAHKQR